MPNPADIRIRRAEVFFLPVQTRVPLKFGSDTLTSVTCARVRTTVEGSGGKTAVGWGETPLSVQWAWPSALGYAPRHKALKNFCGRIAESLVTEKLAGHPMEIGDDFHHHVLPGLTQRYNASSGLGEDLPQLAALVCASAFDIAIHDAYGVLHGVDIYTTYNRRWMSRDLAQFLEPDTPGVDFTGKFPEDFLVAPPVPTKLPAWHLVGGLDPLETSDLTGGEPRDGYPVMLRDWITTDGLTSLKIKLRGTDAAWDYDRIVRVGEIALSSGVTALSTDFNCTVTDPQYVNAILDRLRAEQPEIYSAMLYVEQPFPYDLQKHPIDVSSITSRKPLLLDESAHDWRFIRLGRSLGWSGVALKTCKTQTGALLSLCWAKAHGMPVMVQDLTNPMLAQIPHCRLAAHAGTIRGVETNAMQFYPDASLPEAKVHPGLYRRRDGCVDLTTLRGPGFGYRVSEINRKLPAVSIDRPQRPSL